jgi:hypothetical protein
MPRPRGPSTARRVTALGSGGSYCALEGRTGPQRLILEDFPSVADVKILGPNAGTANRYALSRARRAVHARVFVQVLRQGIRPVPPPVVLTLRYVMPDARHRDVDNFATIGKPVVDGLVKSSILAGDNAARLTQRVEIVCERGRRRLEVVIEEALR